MELPFKCLAVKSPVFPCCCINSAVPWHGVFGSLMCGKMKVHLDNNEEMHFGNSGRRINNYSENYSNKMRY